MILLVLFVLLFIFLFYNFYWKRLGLPPGPTPLPFLGNLLSFAKHPPGEDIQLEWSRKYGGVFTFWIGSSPVVAVTDYDLLVDTFQKDGDAFAGRPLEVEYFNLIRGGRVGILFIDGDFWREQRRFTLQTLKEFGMGKNMLQERIFDELQTLMSRINGQLERSDKVPVSDLIDISVGSIINSILLGYSYSDEKIEEFQELKSRIRNFVRINGYPVQRLIRDYPRFFKHIPYFKGRIKLARDAVGYVQNFFRDRVNEHRREIEEIDPSAPSTDFTMAFIREWNRREQAGERHYFSEQQLVVLLFDLWLDGQDTTSAIVHCFLAHIINYAHVQEKAHKELDSVVKSDRMVSVEDKLDLPYINAIVLETIRIANIVPINLLHRATKDVMIGQYKVKSGTWVVPQISVLLTDDKVFKDPKEFVPERFIGQDGKLKTIPEFIPFSLGKRQCIGEALGKMELFLFVANLLNQYKFLPGDQKPSLERRAGFTVRLDNFTCRPVRRFT